MGKKPKLIEPARRVRAFIAAVDDYERLQQELPMGGSVTVGGHSTHHVGRRYWVAVLHTSMLRKFFAEGDDVALASVVAALRDIVGSAARAEVQEHLARLEEGVAVGWNHSAFQFVLGEAPPVNDGHFVRQQLYGWHLHGDVAKREALEGWSETASLLSMASWTAYAVRAVTVTRDTARLALAEAEGEDVPVEH